MMVCSPLLAMNPLLDTMVHAFLLVHAFLWYMRFYWLKTSNEGVAPIATENYGTRFPIGFKKHVINMVRVNFLLVQNHVTNMIVRTPLLVDYR